MKNIYMKGPLFAPLSRKVEAHLPPKGTIPILLLAPSYPKRPARLHSLNYLAGTLGSSQLLDKIASNSGIKISRPNQPFFVRILDLSVAPKDFNLPVFIKRFGPAIVGVTTTSATIRQALAISELSKTNAPEALRVVGGYHVSAFPETTLQSSSFQVAAFGYGEETMAEIAMALAHYGRKEMIGQLGGVPGIAYKDHHGKILKNEPRVPKIELDELPFPHTVFGQYVLDGYAERGMQEFGSVLAARGCPFSCKYCASEVIHHRRVRARSAESVLQEIAELAASGIRLVMFDEETFTINRELDRLLGGLKELRRQFPDFHWAAETRGDKLPHAVIDKMAEAGLQQMTFGVETGDEALARDVKNSPSLRMDDITAAMEHAQSRGISIGYNLIVGFPGQGFRSILDTAKLLTGHAPDRAAVGQLELYGGTHYQKISASGGQITLRHKTDAMPSFDTADLTHEEMTGVIFDLELLIYYMRYAKKHPTMPKEMTQLMIDAIMDKFRINTLYELLIRSGNNQRDDRHSLYRKAYKSADKIFKALMDDRSNKGITFAGLMAAEADRFLACEWYQKYREALNLHPSIKNTYLDTFLRKVNFENAYCLVNLPFSTLRILLLMLVSFNELYSDGAMTTVIIEDSTTAPQMLKSKLDDKKTADINTAQASFDLEALQSGQTVRYLGIPLKFDREKRALIIASEATEAPSQP